MFKLKSIWQNLAMLFQTIDGVNYGLWLHCLVLLIYHLWACWRLLLLGPLQCFWQTLRRWAWFKGIGTLLDLQTHIYIYTSGYFKTLDSQVAGWPSKNNMLAKTMVLYRFTHGRHGLSSQFDYLDSCLILCTMWQCAFFSECSTFCMAIFVFGYRA